MDKTRFETGMEYLRKIDGAGGQAVLESLKDIAPDLGTYIVEFAFGDIYAREGLTLQEREMIALACLLTAGGCEPQLKVHIQGARNVGIPPQKIIELFLQCIPYTGFPRVLNAVFAAKELFSSASASSTKILESKSQPSLSPGTGSFDTPSVVIRPTFISSSP